MPVPPFVDGQRQLLADRISDLQEDVAFLSSSQITNQGFLAEAQARDDANKEIQDFYTLYVDTWEQEYFAVTGHTITPLSETDVDDAVAGGGRLYPDLDVAPGSHIPPPPGVFPDPFDPRMIPSAMDDIYAADRLTGFVSSTPSELSGLEDELVAINALLAIPEAGRPLNGATPGLVNDWLTALNKELPAIIEEETSLSVAASLGNPLGTLTAAHLNNSTIAAGNAVNARFEVQATVPVADINVTDVELNIRKTQVQTRQDYLLNTRLVLSAQLTEALFLLYNQRYYWLATRANIFGSAFEVAGLEDSIEGVDSRIDQMESEIENLIHALTSTVALQVDSGSVAVEVNDPDLFENSGLLVLSEGLPIEEVLGYTGKAGTTLSGITTPVNVHPIGSDIRQYSA
jgi:hypothetical protein